MEREDDEGPLVFPAAHPVHAVDGGFVREGHGGPEFAVFVRPLEVEDGAAFGFVGGLAGIPLGADGDFHFAVAVDVAGGEADVVAQGEVLGDDGFLPRGVLIPDDFLRVGEEDVGLAVAIDVANGEAVADGDLVIDGLGGEAQAGGGGGEGEREEAEGGFHAVKLE